MSATAKLPWSDEPTPVLPHLGAEFLLWLWYTSDRDGGVTVLDDDLGSVDYWVDTRLAFRAPDEGKAAAVLTGENPSAALEARAALAGGKVLRELRIGLRREEREFLVTLRAPSLDFVGVALPQVVQGGGEEALYDRMYLFDELHRLLVAFFKRFATARASAEWGTEIHPAIRNWVGASLDPGRADRLDSEFEAP
jgi:hypothetical protein